MLRGQTLDEVLKEGWKPAVHLLQLSIVVREELLEIVVCCWCAVDDVFEYEGELVEELFGLFAKGEDAVVHLADMFNSSKIFVKSCVSLTSLCSADLEASAAATHC